MSVLVLLLALGHAQILPSDPSVVHHGTATLRLHSIAQKLASTQVPRIEKIKLLGKIGAEKNEKDLWLLLPSLSIAAQDKSRQVAHPSVERAHDIVTNIDSDFVHMYDIDPEFLGECIKRWLLVTKNSKQWTDIRIRAIEIVHFLERTLPGRFLSFVDFAHDKNDDIRRSVIEKIISYNSDQERSYLVRELAHGYTGIFAAQVLCESHKNTTRDPLDPKSIAKIRLLILEEHGPFDAKLDAARCLISNASNENRLALNRWKNTLNRSQQRALQKIMKR